MRSCIIAPAQKRAYEHEPETLIEKHNSFTHLANVVSGTYSVIETPVLMREWQKQIGKEDKARSRKILLMAHLLADST